MGNKMFDGVISANLDRIEKTIRNFKHIIVVNTIQKTLEGFEGTFLKIPVKWFIKISSQEKKI